MEERAGSLETMAANVTPGIRRVSIKDLDFEDQIRIMWGWCWRQLCVAAVSMVLGAVVGGAFGGVIGVFAVMLGKDISSIRIPLQLMGFFIGMVIAFLSILPLIRWLTKAKYGRYELWLVATMPAEPGVNGDYTWTQRDGHVAETEIGHRLDGGPVTTLSR